jgi:influenza virus NS1A-binding protein
MECYECHLEFEEPHRIPRILTTCGHSLCQSCLNTLWKGSCLSCPQCHVKNPAASVLSFPANLALIQIKQKSPIDTCEIHSKAIEAYCNTDKKVLCVSCILDDGHKSHDITSISKAALRQKEILNTYSSSILANETLINKEEQELDQIGKSLKENFEKLQEEFHAIYETIKETIDQREAENTEKMKNVLQAELNGIENRHNLNQKQLCIIQSFKNELLRNEVESDLEIMSKASKRENLAKQASLKTSGLPKTDPCTQFSRDSEANFFWKMIKQVFACAPKAKVLKKEETVPLALATIAFTKDLRVRPSDLEKKPQQTLLKKELKAKPKSIKTSKKPVQKAPAIVKRATLTLFDDDFRKECTTPKEYSDQDWKENPPKENNSEDDTFSMKSFDLASLCRTPKSYIYAISGFSDKSLVSLECFNFLSNTWDFLAESITSRTQFGAVVHKENILVIGGKQAGKRISTTEVYSPVSNEWSVGDLEMISPRSGFSAMAISSNNYTDDIYVAGGSDGVPLKNFEMWNGEEWVNLPPLKYRRDELAGTVGPDLNIYAVGGYGGNDMTCLSNGERYCLETESWKDIASMSTPRRALSVVTLPDGIYALGGYDGSKYLKTLEKYDIRMGKWVTLAPMKHARCTLSAVTSPDCQFIYTLGGFNGTALNVVERYSVVEDKWTEIPPMQHPRFMHSCLYISL